jgi:hypothetical protein
MLSRKNRLQFIAEHLIRDRGVVPIVNWDRAGAGGELSHARNMSQTDLWCRPHQNPELRRDHVEPLRGLLADYMHGRTAAVAIRVVRLDRHIHARLSLS